MTDITHRPEKSGPEQYAPRNGKRRAQEKSDVDQAAVNALEGEVREFVRRDGTLLHRQRSDADPAAENLNKSIRRVASASIKEIDQVILELQSVRDMLRSEGERVSREITSYANLSQHLTTGMKVVAEKTHAMATRLHQP